MTETKVDLYDPMRWFDLPKNYRLVHLHNDDFVQRIVGIRIGVFFNELQSFVPVNFSLAEGMKYLFYHCPSDVGVVWVDNEGKEIFAPCNATRNYFTNAIALVTFNGKRVLSQAGAYKTSWYDDEPDLEKQVWFSNCGSMLHELGPDGMHKQNGRSYSSYGAELARVRNRMGLTTVGREWDNRRIAEKYKMAVGDDVVLMVVPPVYGSSDPPYPLTAGKVYKLLALDEYGKATITTDTDGTFKLSSARLTKHVTNNSIW